MDSAEAAGPKFSSLYAELAAKSSRVAELEARVSALEAENAGLRDALARREATGSTGDDSRRFVHEAAGGAVARDAIEISDDEEGDADSGRSPEEGVGAVPAPRNRAVAREGEGEADAEAAGGDRGSNGESSAGLEDDDVPAGLEDDDVPAGLEDDDVSVTPRGKKRGAAAAQVVTSDSEDEEGGNGGVEDDLGSGKDDDGDGGEGLTRSRKRAFRRGCDSDDEDGNEGVAQHQTAASGEDHTLPIYELLKRVPREQGSEDGDDSDEAKGHSAPATRRSARLAKNQAKSYRLFHDGSDNEDEDGNEGIAAPQAESGDQEDYDRVPIYQLLKRTPKEKASKHGDESDVARGHSVSATRRSARLVKNQSKRQRAACRALNFIEPKDVQGSEDDMDEDDDMDEFINDDSSDNAGDSAEESCDDSDVPSVLNEKSSPGPEVSDGEVDYKDVMARIGRKKKVKEWDYEADMLAAFGEHPELCLKAVCALYRKQTVDEQAEKAALCNNKQGFSHHDAPRGSRIAEFLLDGDLDGPLKKTVSDLDEYDRYAFEFCRKVASHYSKQLFGIYKNKEDPYFHP